MHKIFGKKENIEYHHRIGAYLIAVNDGKVAVVKTEKGLFLLGGGVDCDETDEETIIRECLEEVGYSALVDKFVCSAETYEKHPSIGYFHPIQRYYLGKLTNYIQNQTEQDHKLIFIEYEKLKGTLYVEMQNWALDICMEKYYKP